MNKVIYTNPRRISKISLLRCFNPQNNQLQTWQGFATVLLTPRRFLPTQQEPLDMGVPVYADRMLIKVRPVHRRSVVNSRWINKPSCRVIRTCKRGHIWMKSIAPDKINLRTRLPVRKRDNLTVAPGSSPSLVNATVLLNFTPPSFFSLPISPRVYQS